MRSTPRSASAIAAGNVVPALVPGFKAMVKQQAKADLVDGKYAVTIGDKAAKDYVTEFLGTEEGKAFKAASCQRRRRRTRREAKDARSRRSPAPNTMRSTRPLRLQPGASGKGELKIVDAVA
jgi:hypothetical protein